MIQKQKTNMKLSEISSSWFHADTKIYLKALQIYVRGDALVLLPFFILLLVIGLFSLKWTALFFCLFLVFRSFGEMIYWLLQQFGEKKYRPYDYGFKKLDNNAIYIIYQLTSLVTLVLSSGLVIFILQYWGN